MGLFKASRDLKKQADQISEHWDPAAQAAQAQEQMKAATQMMADQTAAANVAVTGTPATATIAAVRQGQAMVNFQPSIEVDLTVMPAGGMPYPATVSQVIQQTHLARAQPGATVSVKVDPANPQSIWIDWDTPVA